MIVAYTKERPRHRPMILGFFKSAYLSVPLSLSETAQIIEKSQNHGPVAGRGILFAMENCIFCKIVSKEVPSYTVWENDEYQAFLTIFPNTEGFTVVIPKKHYGSYIFEAPEEIMSGLMRASKEVAKKIENAYPAVGRVGVMFEGFGVNHLHAKLMPLHDTKEDTWTQRLGKPKTFFTTYEGYMSSHDGEKADDAWLAEVAEKIKNA